MKINTAGMIERIASDYGIEKHVVKKVVDAFLQMIIFTLFSGGKVSLKGFGVFYTEDLSEKSAYDLIANNGTCKQYPKRRVPKFKFGNCARIHIRDVK